MISVCHFLLQSKVLVFPQMICTCMLNVCTNPDYLAAARSGWRWATRAPLYIVQVFWLQFLPLSGLCLTLAVLLNLCWCYFNKVTACLYFSVHSVLSNCCIRRGHLLMCMAAAFLTTITWITFA